MSSDVRATIQQVMDGLSASNADMIVDAYTDDIVGIDEVARRWMYGRAEHAAYNESMLASLHNCRSEFDDVREMVVGDVVIVTGYLTQEYEWEGEPQVVEMPATFVLRKENGRWRICLFHALPIPE